LHLFGADIPLTIAAGLLGPKALHGGIATYVLGVLLHFFIAFSFAAFYYAASRRLGFSEGTSADLWIVLWRRC